MGRATKGGRSGSRPVDNDERITRMYMRGVEQDVIAAELGITQGYVSQLVNRSGLVSDAELERRKNKSRRHEAHCKIPEDDYPLIHRLLDEGETQAKVAKMFGVDPSRISRIRKSGKGRTRRYKRVP